MNRDLTQHLLAGANSSPPPLTRRAEPSAAPPPPPRTARVNDRCETGLTYAGAWREQIYRPAEDDDGEGLEDEFDPAEDGEEDAEDDDGAVYVPLGGGR
ncbi:hypothetical protein ACWCYZ_39575 [Streptomyces virginiae]